MIHISGWKSVMAAVSGMFGIAVFLCATAAPPGQPATPATAEEVVLELDPAQSKVRFLVDSTFHTVHGTFSLKSGTVYFDPESGKAGGEIIVQATSGNTGNSSRDGRMQREILETAKYPDAVFRPEQIEGKVARSGTSDVKLHGVILLHGREHDIVAAVHAELAAGRWKGTARFDVPYIEWGLKDPSNWLLRVKPVVHVELEMLGPSKSEK